MPLVLPRPLCQPLPWLLLALAGGVCLALVLPRAGLRHDLCSLLRARGLEVQVLEVHASPRSRQGCLVLAGGSALARDMASRLGLVPVSPDSWRALLGPFPDLPRAAPGRIWARRGRSDAFLLPHGARFEWICLLEGRDGRLYLVAEYAYG